MRIQSPSIAVFHRQRALYSAGVGALLCGIVAAAAPAVLSRVPGILLSIVAGVLSLGYAGIAITSRGEPVAGRGAIGRRGVVDVTGSDILVSTGGSELRIPRASVVAGWIEEAGAHPTVILQTDAGTTIYARVDAAATAERLLQEIGVAPAQRAILMLVGLPRELGGTGQRAFKMLLLGFCGLIMAVLGLAMLVGGLAVLARELDRAVPSILVGALTVALGVWCLSRALVRAAPWSIRIGTDGLVLKRLRRRFLSFHKLKAAEAIGSEIALDRADEEPLRILTSSPEEAAAVVARILHAKAAGERGSEAGRLTVLDRAGRSLDEWRQELASLVRPGAYRERRVSPADLAEVVEDARAPICRRVAAAVALAGSEESVRRRARVAVDACAEPRLRVALDKALEGEIDEELLAEAESAAEARS